MVAKYGKTSDKYYLQKAINSLDTSIKCETTKDKSINLKITTYFLLKDYNSGLAFVDSLKMEDFNKAYKKELFRDLFKASRLEFIGDSAGSKLIYSHIASNINQVLQQTNSNILEKEAYGNLIFAESKYLPASEISKQLEALKIKFPTESNFIDILVKQYVSPPSLEF